MRHIVTLTVEQISDLTLLSGPELKDLEQDYSEAEIAIYDPEGEPLSELDGEIKTEQWYEFVACLVDYPEEGYVGLGKILKEIKSKVE